VNTETFEKLQSDTCATVPIALLLKWFLCTDGAG